MPWKYGHCCSMLILLLQVVLVFTIDLNPMQINGFDHAPVYDFNAPAWITCFNAHFWFYSVNTPRLSSMRWRSLCTAFHMKPRTLLLRYSYGEAEGYNITIKNIVVYWKNSFIIFLASLAQYPMVLLKNVTILSIIIQDCTYKIVLFVTNMSGLYITKYFVLRKTCESPV